MGQTAQLIDAEMRSIVDTAWATASDIIQAHMVEMNSLAEELLVKETLDSDDLDGILGPKPTSPRHDELTAGVTGTDVVAEASGEA